MGMNELIIKVMFFYITYENVSDVAKFIYIRLSVWKLDGKWNLNKQYICNKSFTSTSLINTT